MKKFKETIERVISEEIEYSVVPCINCGNEDVQHHFNHSDKSTPIILVKNEKYSTNGTHYEYGAYCSKCDAEFLETSNKEKYYKDAAKIWNNNNDIDLLIKKQEKEAALINARIEVLNTLKKQKENKEIKSKLTNKGSKVANVIPHHPA